jgi:hypothetical protein
MAPPCISQALFFIGIADCLSLGCSELHLKSQKFLAAIHLMDSKRLDLNLQLTPEALLAEQNVTKAAFGLHLSQPAVSAQLGLLPHSLHRGVGLNRRGVDALHPVQAADSATRRPSDTRPRTQ